MPASRSGADVAAAREAWREMQQGLDPSRLVLLDESGVKTNMARRRGRAKKGERLVASIPHGHWKSLTFVAGLRGDRIDAPWVLDGAMNGEAFLTYLRKILEPTLAAGDIVIMDNLPAHNVAGVRQTIDATGAKLLYLPLYSPDLNPIEMMFAGSRRSCERPPNEPSMASGNASARFSIGSPQQNAETTSPRPDMRQPDRTSL